MQSWNPLLVQCFVYRAWMRPAGQHIKEVPTSCCNGETLLAQFVWVFPACYCIDAKNNANICTDIVPILWIVFGLELETPTNSSFAVCLLVVTKYCVYSVAQLKGIYFLAYLKMVWNSRLTAFFKCCCMSYLSLCCQNSEQIYRHSLSCRFNAEHKLWGRRNDLICLSMQIVM